MYFWLVDNRDGDSFELLFTNEHDALVTAEKYWHDIGPIQRRHRREFYVCSCRATSDLCIDYEDPDLVVIKDFLKGE